MTDLIQDFYILKVSRQSFNRRIIYLPINSRILRGTSVLVCPLNMDDLLLLMNYKKSKLIQKAKESATELGSKR